MFGTFTESALLAYAERATQAFKEKKVAGNLQGTEKHDNFGIGDHDHSFIDNDESQDADDYSEHYDFTTCLRPNGTLYGIGGGKCRKGTEVSADAVARLKQERKFPKQKQREAIRKRGETAVKRDKAEGILKGLQQEGPRDRKATERRAEKGKGGDREEQVRQLRAKAFLTMDRLRQKAKKMVAGPRKEQVEARIARLLAVMGRLDKTQKALRDTKPKQKSEGFGRIPAIYETGRGLG
jgi:coproporphyrinogen III oxidase-like Fe-S oxidoreductase